MKISKLTIVNIVLATILVSSLFLMSSTATVGSKMTRSYEASSLDVYDPWLDYNNDGVIDWYDFNRISMRDQYVTLTNLPLDENGNLKVNLTSGLAYCCQMNGFNKSWGPVNVPAHGYWESSPVVVDGYKQYYIHEIIGGSAGTITLHYQFKAGSTIFISAQETHPSIPFTRISGPYDIAGPEFRVVVGNGANAFDISVEFTIYALPS
jgi:hypothetical protein